MSETKFEAQMELSRVQSTQGYPGSEATRGCPRHKVQQYLPVKLSF